jgi:hypothetical protein
LPLPDIGGKKNSAVLESPAMNERQQAHIDFYLERLKYWQGRKPHGSTARLMAAGDADEAHPLRSEQEATEVVEYLLRLERQENHSTEKVDKG